MSIGTRYKFRHYRPDDAGVDRLIWASDGPRDSLDLGRGRGPAKGSAGDLEVIGGQLWTPNALVDEGEKDILDVYFDDIAVRTSLFFRLYSDGAIAETDTLATLINEVTGTGYGGVSIARGTDWSDPALNVGDMQTTTVTKSFNAGGVWTAADELVLATVGTGTAGLFLAWAALSATRTLTNGDQLDVTMSVKLA